MSNLARKQQGSYHYQPMQQPEKKVKVVKKRSTITPGEKFLLAILAAFVIIMSVQIISAQSQIYVVSKEITDLKRSIQEQEKDNSDLGAQISDLKNYERIRDKAKEQDMIFDENNVKVVEER